MKKIIPVLVALILIGIVGYVSFGDEIREKYAYGKEWADLDAYFGVTHPSIDKGDGELAIVLQDELVSEKAIMKSGKVYFEYEWVKEYFTNDFYINSEGSAMLYTGATDTKTVYIGDSFYSDADGEHGLGGSICYREGEKLYIMADYLLMFSNFSYRVYDRHIQLYTEWGIRETYTVSKDTQLRSEEGIKSPILQELTTGEKVEILDEKENWVIVKTDSAIIGYVEKKYLTGYDTSVETAVKDYVPEEYVGNPFGGKVCLGWHAIAGVGGNDTLTAALEENKGINVIAPTWFSLTDSEGNFQSFASSKYVERAHKAGLEVWGTWDDFNYALNHDIVIDSFALFSDSENRKNLAEKMVATTLEYGIDGINIDFEDLSSAAKEHFIQFLKELSILCRANEITLSVDNYAPLNSKNTARFDIQGRVADYVIIMGYDENGPGSAQAGSVASIGFVSGGIDRVLEHVEPGKVINAVPFYTRQWKTTGTEVVSEAIPINNLESYMDRLGKRSEIVWDEETCQNYLEWKQGDTLCQIWLEDKESLKVKLNVMAVKELGGVAVWRLGYGTTEVWNLVAAYAGTKK